MKDKREHINKELRELNSFLADVQLSSPEVPEGFFDRLEKEILTKTVEPEVKKGRVVKMGWLKFVASAAAVFVIVFIGIRLIGNRNDSSLEMQLAGMNTAELEKYIDQQVASISADDLHTFISENIDDIDAGLFSETELIDNSYMQEELIEHVNLEMLDGEAVDNNEPLLDKELLDQIDDETIEQLLNDELMFDDFAL